MQKAYKQFLLTEYDIPVPDTWKSQRISNLVLSYCSSLPVKRVKANGVSGFIVGWTPAGLAGVPGEDYSDLGGRWFFLSDQGSIHLDPLGSYSIVYSANLRMAASSTFVMPQNELIPDEDLNAGLNLPKVDCWYPFGLTPYKNVSRLLPGHELNLTTFAPNRSSHTRQPSVITDPVETIARNLSDQLDLLKRSPIIMGMTAGNETRMIMAGLKEPTDSCSFFTIAGTGNNQDSITAMYLAKKFKLSHTNVRPARDPSEESLWFDRVGRCVSGAALRNAKAKSLLSGESVLVKGIGGEIGRGYYYRDRDRDGVIPSIDELIIRMGIPPLPKIIDAGNRWLETAPFADIYTLLDLLYVENRVGCWAAPQLHGDIYNRACVWPLNQASTITAMKQLPHHIKATDQMCPLVVAKLWPALLSVPINESFGFRKAISKLRGFIKQRRLSDISEAG